MAANSSRGRPWRRVKALVLQRDGHRCQMRGPKCIGHATTVDHIIAKAHGGTDHPSNLRAACAPCNYAGGARITNAARRTRSATRKRPQPYTTEVTPIRWG